MNISTKACFGLKTVEFEPTTSVIFTAIGVSVFNSVLAVLATFGNSLMLFVLATKRCLRTPSNLLICSLCVTDFLVGLIVQPLHVVSRVYEVRGIHVCDVKLVYAYFAFLCSGASFLNVMLISIDRWFAVCHPFRYEVKASLKKYSLIIACIWLFWIGMTSLPFIGAISAKQYNFVLILSAVLSISVIFICYGSIYGVARRLRRANPALNSVTPSGTELRAKNRREQRKSNTVAIIILTLLACYAPNLVCGLLESIIGYSLDLAYVAWHWTGLLVFANSSINPFLYCIRSSDIRLAVLRELNKRTRLFKKNSITTKTQAVQNR